MWLVTPQIIFSGTQILSFSSAMANWVDNSLTAMVSTNFTGDVNTATWTPVTGATIAGQTNANDEWVPSGNISLASFLPSGYSGNFVVAFKYEGTAANSTTYRVDNVAVN